MYIDRSHSIYSLRIHAGYKVSQIDNKPIVLPDSNVQCAMCNVHPKNCTVSHYKPIDLYSALLRDLLLSAFDSVCMFVRLSTETEMLLLFHPLIELGNFWRDNRTLGSTKR